MRITRRRFLNSTVVAIAAPALVRRALADAPQFAFKLQHPLSAVSSEHDKFIAPWARQIEAQSGGRIRIDIFPSMELGGAPAQLFDQAREGAADIVWTAPSYTPGRFPKIELFELPFLPSRRALVSSKAIQDFAEADLKDEFRDVHPICFACSDRSVVHSKKPIQTVQDVKGLRLHVQTRLAGDAVTALGAHPVPMPSAQLPLAIAQHVVDGCIDPWDVTPSLKLQDLLKAHTDFADLSLSTVTFVLAMNKTAYNRLPADLKKIVDDNSGQAAATMAGTMWDLQAGVVADTVSARGDSIITLQPEAVAHWRKATEPVIDAWRKQMKERKVDGGKLLANAEAYVEKYLLRAGAAAAASGPAATASGGDGGSQYDGKSRKPVRGIGSACSAHGQSLAAEPAGGNGCVAAARCRFNRAIAASGSRCSAAACREARAGTCAIAAHREARPSASNTAKEPGHSDLN